MATVTGYVERIKYRNEDNGYSVLSVADGGEEYILVGTFPYISEGERIEATGRMVEHSIYGEQLAVESYEIKAPEDTLAIERYLGSGAIKGIGAALAKRIVKKFKADTFRIIEEEPERLSEVKGISERMAMEISSQVEEKRELRQAMLFLQQYGIHMNLAVKIYQQYKKYYDALKSVNNLVKDARKVSEIILMVGDVSEIYVTNFQKMLGDENFSPEELDAIAFGYTKLLEESNGVLQDLRQVINVSTLSMTDKDRMDVVDDCYASMRRYRNLVNYYTNRNIAVSFLRARKKNDLDRVLKLYGNDISKYW